jgi:asparagine synthase (glutamine-hydrolysing)
VFWHQEEPFTSTSVYAQWSVMRLARQHDVTVLLDGQGADEMLAGYHVYFDVLADDLMKSLNLPAYLSWRKECQTLHGLAPGSLKRIMIQSLPRGFKQTVKSLRQKTRGLPDLEPLVPTYPAEFKKVSGLRKLLWWNTTRQGLVELLRYADRNSMAHSREVRLPFLDHRLVEFVFSLPDRCLHRNGWTKWILREALRDIIPSEIANRVDKLGYMPPQQRWIGTRVWEDIMLEQLKQGGTTLPISDPMDAAPVAQLV